MKFKIICPICKAEFWIRGHEEPDVNATVLDDNDAEWDNVCEHIGKTGEYDICGEVEYKHWEDNVI